MILDAIRRSLRAKFALGFFLPLIVLLGLSSYLQYVRHEEAHVEALLLLAGQTTQAVENSLQNEMLNRNLEGLQHTIDAIGEGEAIEAIAILDPSGRVAMAPGRANVGQVLDNRDPTCQPCHQSPAEARPTSVIVDLPGQGRVFRSMNPIENRPECHTCHDPTQRVNGLLLVDIAMSSVDEPLAVDLREHVLWPALTIAVVMLMTVVTVSRFVIRPVGRLGQRVSGFHLGQDEVRTPVDSPDEIGQLAQAFNDMTHRIHLEEQGNRDLSEQLQAQAEARSQLLLRLTTAQEEERRRVARDLHDDLGQDLAGAAMQLEVVAREQPQPSPRAQRALERARALIAVASDHVYSVILSLRPAGLDDLGLEAAIRAHAERLFEDTGIHFELDTNGLQERLPAEMETTIFRIFQEGLSNVLRHGQARQVRLSLRVAAGFFEGEISDDGIGFDPAALAASPAGSEVRGLGLLGMQERISPWGGEVRVTSEPGRGTRLSMRIPLPESADGE